MSQKQQVLEWLEEGNSLTPLEALNMFNSWRLGDIIHKLRKEGYFIKTNINKEGKKYAIYRLIQEQQTKLKLEGT